MKVNEKLEIIPHPLYIHSQKPSDKWNIFSRNVFLSNYKGRYEICMKASSGPGNAIHHRLKNSIKYRLFQIKFLLRVFVGWGFGINLRPRYVTWQVKLERQSLCNHWKNRTFYKSPAAFSSVNSEFLGLEFSGSHCRGPHLLFIIFGTNRTVFSREEKPARPLLGLQKVWAH